MQKAVNEAVAFQRNLAVEEQAQARKTIADAGCEIIEPSPAEHAAFVAAVQPLTDDARNMYGEEMFELVPQA
ncbi:MAG: hypothetical protein ACREB8_11505, partial [Pseudolabrys sp.]